METCPKIRDGIDIRSHLDRLKEKNFSDWKREEQNEAIRDFAWLHLKITQAEMEGSPTKEDGIIHDTRFKTNGAGAATQTAIARKRGRPRKDWEWSKDRSESINTR